VIQPRQRKEILSSGKKRMFLERIKLAVEQDVTQRPKKGVATFLPLNSPLRIAKADSRVMGTTREYPGRSGASHSHTLQDVLAPQTLLWMRSDAITHVRTIFCPSTV
jgi:hypothetical protein